MTSKRYSARHRPKFDEYIFDWSGKFAVAMFLVGVAVGPIVVWFREEEPALVLYVLSLLAGGVLFAGIGYGAGLIIRAYQFDIIFFQTLDEEEPEQFLAPKPENRPKRDYSIVVDLKNGLGSVTIWQPRPASFTSWLGEVVKDNTRIQFSKHQAEIRAWPIDRYDVMIAQLRQIGLLHSHDMHNNAPVLTDEGRKQAKDWLRYHV